MRVGPRHSHGCLETKVVLDSWKMKSINIFKRSDTELNDERNETHHISCPPAPVLPHSVLVVLPAGPDSSISHRKTRQSGGETVPG